MILQSDALSSLSAGAATVGVTRARVVGRTVIVAGATTAVPGAVLIIPVAIGGGTVVTIPTVVVSRVGVLAMATDLLHIVVGANVSPVVFALGHSTVEVSGTSGGPAPAHATSTVEARRAGLGPATNRV